MVARQVFSLVNRLFPHVDAHAHCDIPCGIYDPHYAQVAALSVIRMNQMIDQMEAPAMEKAARDKYMHQLARLTLVKEEHAEIVKREVRIIRGDFFKPENSPENIGELIAQPDVDGALVGGASLDVRSFVEIVNRSRAAGV